MKNIKLSECPRHGLTEFYLNNKGIWRCKKCNIENVTKRRRLIKIKLVEYKGGKCEICGYNKSYRALEFHHLNPLEKEHKISSSNSSLETLKKEVDKCILVCSNCHMEIHEKLDNEKQKEIELEIQNNINQYQKQHSKHRRNNKQCNLNIDYIINDIKSGLKQSEIALKYNISVATLKRFLTSKGVSMGKKRK